MSVNPANNLKIFIILVLVVVNDCLFASVPFALSPGGKNVRGTRIAAGRLNAGWIVELRAGIRQAFCGMAGGLGLVLTQIVEALRCESRAFSIYLAGRDIHSLFKAVCGAVLANSRLCTHSL